MCAASNGHYDIVQYLMEAEANTEVIDQVILFMQ
jgi:hypothetical protein